jgi:lipase
VRLHTHEWGDPEAPLVVCLHGVTGHGGRFRKLAEERLADRFHVVAPDLRGHGRSTWDEPWDLGTHLADMLDTVGGPATWIGHSFGGRLVMEITARRPDLVQRAVLLDPAIFAPPQIARELAEEESVERSFGSVDEAIEAREISGGLVSTPRAMLEEEMSAHLVASEDGRFRYRYSQPSVGADYLEIGTPPPPYEALRVPSLLVVGTLSKIVSAGEAELYRAALGDLLEVVVVPGGHTVLWDAYDETAGAIEEFLAPRARLKLKT